jgi:asparagine synthase (glutamine-hydrolysing)
VLNEQLNAMPEGNSAFFFNRLAIMDLDHRSDQPFEDEHHLLTFNGEIYNYQELKVQLQAKGYTFQTTSDTEVLFFGLKEWGSKILGKLNGMFAFFWLDKKEKTFLVARDRLGIKPLYYYQEKNSFVFASELTSIIRLSGIKAEISHEAVDMYLWLQFVPAPYSIIKGIKKLPPGYFLQGKLRENLIVELTEYWDAYQYALSTPASDETLEKVLTDSLQRQLHADVPLGLFLSSGVDSSLLAALVNKYFAKDRDFNFFTVQFEENTSSDESDDARRFIEQFNNPNLHCNTLKINSEIIRNRLYRLYDYYDEPFADPASLLNWVISEKAREFVTVAISGDGADELFWGYPRYTRWQHFTEINRIPVLSNIARTLSLLPPSSFRNNAMFVMEKDPVKRHFNFFPRECVGKHKIISHNTICGRWKMWVK